MGLARCGFGGYDSMSLSKEELDERYRELRNIAGLTSVIYIAMSIYYVLTSTPEEIGKFGMFIIIGGIMFVLLGWKTLQCRGWI